MHCIHCGSEWNTISTTVVLFCPFCNSPLVPIPDDLTDFEEVISYLVSSYGKAVLSNQQTTFRFLEACLPNARKERNFLRYAYAGNVISQLCSVDCTDCAAVENVKKRACYILESDYGVATDWANYIVFSIMKSLGAATQDDSVSVIYTRRQADRDDSSAQYKLAQMYLDGVGVSANSESYLYWLIRSAKNGHAAAKYELASCYVDGTICEKNTSEALRLLREVLEVIPLAAVYALNHATDLALCDADYTRIVTFLQYNASSIGWKANLALAKYYYSQASFTEAMVYAEKVYSERPSDAWEIYCKLLEIRNGLGDAATAIKVMKDAVNDGSSKAAFLLAEKHKNGNGVPVNYSIALSWYRQAANAGDVASLLQIGEMYEHGLGVPRDTEQAILWYRRAAYAGSNVARKKISYRNRKLMNSITLQFDDDTELTCPVVAVFDYHGNSYLIVKDPDSLDLFAYGYKEVRSFDGYEISNLDDRTFDQVIKAYRNRY